MVFSRALRFLSKLSVLVVTAVMSAQPAPAEELQALVKRAGETVLEKFQGEGLKQEQLAMTLVDLSDPTGAKQASVRGDVPIYPASVIKLFYLAAAQRWMEDGKLEDTPELRRSLTDMIVVSSNDATHYVIDLLTGTTSGPELPEAELKVWFERRAAVTRHFVALGYSGVNASKKPWADGPYGRESQAIRLMEPKRNMLTTDATARLLMEIVTSHCVTAKRSAEMMGLLMRNPSATSPDPDDQATKFIGPALPPGAKLWSKAGWTSQVRHDAAYVELPSGAKFILVIFTTGHAGRQEIIQSVAAIIVAGMTKRE